MSQDDVRLSPELIAQLNKLASRLTEQGEYEAVDLIDTVVARVTAMPGRELLREALAYAHQLEQCVAEFLDAYTAFNNDELDEVSMNDAEHGMKLAMYAFRETRAAADKIRAALDKGEPKP